MFNKVIDTWASNRRAGKLSRRDPIRGAARSTNGLVTLVTTSAADAQLIRQYAHEWIQQIDNDATRPLETYNVVAHATPASLWTEGTDPTEALVDIALSNPDLQLDADLIGISWLNNAKTRTNAGSGPLKIDLLTKSSANRTMDAGLVLKGVSCRVTIYVPRPIHCFRVKAGDTGRRNAPGRPNVASVPEIIIRRTPLRSRPVLSYRSDLPKCRRNSEMCQLRRRASSLGSIMSSSQGRTRSTDSPTRIYDRTF